MLIMNILVNIQYETGTIVNILICHYACI